MMDSLYCFCLLAESYEKINQYHSCYKNTSLFYFRFRLVASSNFRTFFCGFQTEQCSKIWWCIEIKKTSRMSGIFWAKLSETQMKSVCWMITNSYPPLEPELQTDQSLCWLWTPFCYTFSTDQDKVSSNSTMCCQTKPTAVSNEQECNYTMTWISSANWKRLRLWTRWSVCRPHTGPVRLSGWLNIFTQLYAGYAVVNGLPHWTENGF